MSDAFKEALAAYIAAALWSSTDDSGLPLDEDKFELSVEVRAELEKDFGNFYEAQNIATMSNDDQKKAAVDFWLTRNHHGAGFWDGDWPEPLSKQLTDASHAFGPCELYIGDDKKIYSI